MGGQGLNDTEHTHASRVCIELVGSCRVEWDEFLPSVEDEGVIDCGVSIFPDGEKGKGNRPTRLHWLQVIVGASELTRLFDCPFLLHDRTRGTCPGECGFHPLLR